MLMNVLLLKQFGFVDKTDISNRSSCRLVRYLNCDLPDCETSVFWLKHSELNRPAAALVLKLKNWQKNHGNIS